MRVAAKTRMRPENDLDRIDRLIDWYIKFKPEAGQRISVAIPPEKLWRLTGQIPPTPITKEVPYRERTLVSV